MSIKHFLRPVDDAFDVPNHTIGHTFGTAFAFANLGTPEDRPMRSPNKISDAELRAAEGIHTRDPADPNAAGHQLWGNQSAASQPNDSANIVEIALASDDHQALLALIARIENLKGSLPPDVAVLRENLGT